MGLFGNIFKPLQGKLTAKQEENMKKVAEVFKEKTGKDYQTAVVWKMTTKKKLTKTVHTYYNWLMGYGIDDNNIPEIVLIPVDPKWDWIDEPIYCKKTNSEMTQDKKTSLFILKNDQLEDGKIDLQLISSVAMMENYLMDVNYLPLFCPGYMRGSFFPLRKEDAGAPGHSAGPPPSLRGSAAAEDAVL